MIRSVLALALLAPASAFACGGFFCNGITPIQQEAERILFEVQPDDTITATVEVQYSGQPADFSWIVPVPRGFDASQVGIGDPELFNALEKSTAPTFFREGEVETWTVTDGGVATEVETWDTINGGWSCSGSTGSRRVRSVEIEYSPETEREETIEHPDEVVVDANLASSTDVGPYEAQVIAAATGADLLAWLTEAGYAVPDEAAARAEPYIAANMSFLALRLQPTAAEGALAPIILKYDGSVPAIPLVLTGVAAADDMEVVVYVAAQDLYEPDNFARIDDYPFDDVEIAGWGGTNYGVILRDEIEDRQGRAFITEYANESGAPDFLGGLPYLTRMRTFIGPDAMTVDPGFRGGGGFVSNFHELPPRLEDASIPWWLILAAVGVRRRQR